MIVDIIKRTALIEVRTGPMGRAGERGIQGQQGVAGPQGQQGVPGQQGIAGTTSWIGLTDKPATFPPSAHTHSAADITTGALAIANGGTGSTTALAARAALGLTLAVDVQPHSNVLDALLPLNVLDTPGDVGTTLQLGSGANYVDDNATTLGGDAGEIRMVGGDAYGDASIQRGGGDAGSILMLGGNASDQYDGGAAGTVNTSGSGQYFGGSLQMNATDQNAGSINTQAGGNLTMGTANVSGPAVAGTLLTDASSLPAANLTGTIAAARLGSGTADATTYLRGDGAWATVTGGVTSITGTANQITVTGTTAPTLSLPATITGLTSVTSTTFVGALTGTASGNATISANIFTGAQSIANTTAAISGTQQVSPDLVLEGRGWATTGSQSQSVRVRQNVLPVQGAAPTANWRLQADINAAGTWPTFFQVTSGGVISTTGTNNLTLGTDPRLTQGATSRPLELATTLGAVTIVDGGANGQRLAFSSTLSNTSPTTQFVSIASAAISQRSGTTAQSFSVAKTWTSATNFEHGVMDWQTTTDVLRIGSSKGSGGGSNREVRFIMGDTAKITLDTAGNVILSGLPTSAPATSGALWCDSANGNVIKMVS